MQIEYEGRILNINPEQLKKKIKLLGGYIKSPLTLYRRTVFNLGDIKRGFVRVRDEGEKITMTSKIYKKDNLNFPEEHELTINNTFEQGQEFLRSLNLKEKAYHETIREKWTIPRNNKKSSKTKKHSTLNLNKYSNSQKHSKSQKYSNSHTKINKNKQLESQKELELCEVSIDYIPGLPVYAELECKSKSDLQLVCKLLDVKYNELSFGGYGKVYTEYYGMAENDINNVIPLLTFKNITNELKPYLHKNHDILNQIALSHLKIYKKIKK